MVIHPSGTHTRCYHSPAYENAGHKSNRYKQTYNIIEENL